MQSSPDGVADTCGSLLDSAAYRVTDFTHYEDAQVVRPDSKLALIPWLHAELRR